MIPENLQILLLLLMLGLVKSQKFYKAQLHSDIQQEQQKNPLRFIFVHRRKHSTQVN